MVRILERCFNDENTDDEYFKEYYKFSWKFANKYMELSNSKKDFQLKKINIVNNEFNRLYNNNYNYNSSLILSNNIANKALNNHYNNLFKKQMELNEIELNYIKYRNLCYNV